MLKRISDIILALFGMLVLFPFVLLLAIFMPIQQGLPLFYIKHTMGKDGKTFKMFKFRTMKNHSEHVTNIGELLRQTAADELPQLLNILKGEMSFVGPRPYSAGKYEKAEAHFSERLAATPGLTGYAQVFLPKYASDGEVLKYDLEYIKKKSFVFDLYIILASIVITVKGGWESTARKF